MERKKLEEKLSPKPISTTAAAATTTPVVATKQTDTPQVKSPVVTSTPVAKQDKPQEKVSQPKSQPKPEPKPEPKIEPKPEPKSEPKQEPKQEPQEKNNDDEDESEDRSQPQISEAGSEVDPNEDLTQSVPMLVRKKSISYTSGGAPYGHHRQYSRQYSVVSKKGGRAHAPSISSQRTDEEKRERKQRKKREKEEREAREAAEEEERRKKAPPPADDEEDNEEDDDRSETASVRLRSGSVVELQPAQREIKAVEKSDNEEEDDEESEGSEEDAGNKWGRGGSVIQKLEDDDPSLKDMGEREKKMKLREDVVGDIYDNEEQYVTQLRIIDQLYIKGLEKRKRNYKCGTWTYIF